MHKGAPRRLFYRGFVPHDHIDVEFGDDLIGSTVRESFETGICPICSLGFARYERMPTSTNVPKSVTAIDLKPILFFCRHCGWWQLRAVGLVSNLDGMQNSGTALKARYAYEYHSLLEELDISSKDIPLNDLRAHLVRNWEDRRFISAGKAEDLVAGVLRDYLGCDVYHATANVNARDGGIDLFVCSADGHIQAAVQVKRRVTRSVESVLNVRNFIGALVVEGYNKGIFVTTASRFSSGAEQIPERAGLKHHKLELELVDGERLLELMEATSTNFRLTLPDLITDQTQWEGTDGSTTTTDELLLGQQT